MNLFKAILYSAIFGLAFIISVGDVHSQSKRTRAELEKEKADVQKRLLEFDLILKQTADRKKNTLGELKAVNVQLDARMAYINTLNREVNLIDSEISQTEK